jgi:hypothetical protein
VREAVGPIRGRIWYLDIRSFDVNSSSISSGPAAGLWISIRFWPAAMVHDKYIGLALAVSGSLAIGTSFIITKKVQPARCHEPMLSTQMFVS